jgi:hypothetical protein
LYFNARDAFLVQSSSGTIKRLESQIIDMFLRVNKRAWIGYPKSTNVTYASVREDTLYFNNKYNIKELSISIVNWYLIKHVSSQTLTTGQIILDQKEVEISWVTSTFPVFHWCCDQKEVEISWVTSTFPVFHWWFLSFTFATSHHTSRDDFLWLIRFYFMLITPSAGFTIVLKHRTPLASRAHLPAKISFTMSDLI